MHALLDWPIYQDIFSASGMRAVFSQAATVARWIEVETAIAAAQADLGLIPTAAAAAIAAAADPKSIDIDRLAADMMLAGRPIIGLCTQLRERVGPEHEDWVHWGATTQDVMDTATVLQMRDGIGQVQTRIDGLVARLSVLAAEHQHTPIIGRTNQQHAQPLSLGLKLSVWVEELGRRRRALDESASRGLMLQFGGAVGSLAAFGVDGPRLRQKIGERLDLPVRETHWQNARDGVADILSALGILCATIEKIAHEVNALAGTDIAELSEGHAPGRGASSAMTHKRNQRGSEFAEAVARLGRQRAAVAPELMRHEHERSGGVWIAEWVTVPEVFLYTSSALHWAQAVFDGVEVNTDAMARNVAATRGLVFSETVTLALAAKVGRGEAKRLVAKACDSVRAEKLTLEEALASDPAVTRSVSEDEIAGFFDLTSHLGSR